ncbi:FtsX-like permease family protein [Luethyella okanaganae]|uniref:FtsX-like permease family protein n=1 Tax=Luethyella okanaganae TaxID=69372 RepID=A0ABW1VHN3_9MICO
MIVVSVFLGLALDFWTTIGTPRNAAQLSSQTGAKGVLQQIVLFTIIAGILIPAWIVFSSVGRARVQESRPRLAQWRLAGASPWQVGSAILLQSVAMAFLASLVGWSIAVPLSGWSTRAIFLATDIRVDLDPAFGLPSLVLTVAISLGASALGALQPAIRASRIPPAEALREATQQQPRISPFRWVAFGVTIMASIGLAYSVATASGNGTASTETILLGVLLLIDAAWVAPRFIPWAIARWTSLVRPRGSSWFLARHAAIAYSDIAVATVMPFAVAGGLLGTYFGAAATWSSSTGQVAGTLDRLEQQGLVLFLPALVIALAGSIASIFTAARRRSRETALLVSLGAPGGALGIQPLLEGLIFALTSLLIGLLVSTLATFIYSIALATHGARWNPTIAWMPQAAFAAAALIVSWLALQTSAQPATSVSTRELLSKDA